MSTRIPKLVSIELAIQMYYENLELTTSDICKLFASGRNKAVNLKKMAADYMAENNIKTWNALAVDTEAAYNSWGIDINDLETRYSKLKKMKLA